MGRSTLSDNVKKYSLIAIAVAVALTIIISISAIYTSQSGFCTSCHYMQTFYDSWKTSKHADIECIQCHFAPGLKNKIRGKMEGLVQIVKYVSLAYKKSKPWAEIPDESCLREGCHETRLLEGEVEFLEGIVFDHKHHLTELRRGKKLRCTSCHSQIVQGEHISVTESTCFICHFKNAEDTGEKLSECTTCHSRKIMLEKSRDGVLKYDHTQIIEKKLGCTDCHSGTIVGDAPVYRQSCFTCHWEAERLEQFENTTLMHEQHIAVHKIECLNCHMAIDHRISKKDIQTRAECLTCHPTHHDAKKALFSGTGGKNAKEHPSKMFEIGLNCRGCHIFHGDVASGKGDEATFVAREKSCDACHEPGLGKLLAEWEKSTGKKMAQLKKIMNTLRVDVKASKMDRDKTAKAEELLADAQYNMDMVENGKSLHNIRYANDLLASSFEMQKEAATLIGSNYTLPSIVTGDMQKMECLTCHFDIKQQKPSFAGLTFSHKNHLERGRVCTDCHSANGRHGNLKITKPECADCHHRETVKKGCPDCHQLQTEIYGGLWKFSDGQANLMGDAVECEGCHGELVDIARPQKEICLDCHDPGYEAMMTEWQDTVAELITEISLKLDFLRAENPDILEMSEIKEVEEFLNDIKSDGSRGVHNPLAIDQAGSAYMEQLDKVVTPLGYKKE